MLVNRSLGTEYKPLIPVFSGSKLADLNVVQAKEIEADYFTTDHWQLETYGTKLRGILKPSVCRGHIAVTWEADLQEMYTAPDRKVRSKPFQFSLPGVGLYTLYLLAKPRPGSSAIGIYLHAVGNRFPLHLDGSVFECGPYATVFSSPHRDVISLSGNGRGVPSFISGPEAMTYFRSTIVRVCVDIHLSCLLGG